VSYFLALLHIIIIEDIASDNMKYFIEHSLYIALVMVMVIDKRTYRQL